MSETQIIRSLIHNNRHWDIVRINNSYYARSEGSDTGPYSTEQQAEEFITSIRQENDDVFKGFRGNNDSA